MKWGVFCKKVDLSSTQGALCTVSVFFILHFTYLEGVLTHPTHPPAYVPAYTPIGDIKKCCDPCVGPSVCPKTLDENGAFLDYDCYKTLTGNTMLDTIRYDTTCYFNTQ